MFPVIMGTPKGPTGAEICYLLSIGSLYFQTQHFLKRASPEYTDMEKVSGTNLIRGKCQPFLFSVTCISPPSATHTPNDREMCFKFQLLT